MTVFKRIMALVLVMTMLLSFGEVFAFASEPAVDGSPAPENIEGKGEPDLQETAEPSASPEAGEEQDDGDTAASPAPVPSESPAPEGDGGLGLPGIVIPIPSTPIPETSEEPEATEVPETTEEPEATEAPEPKQWPWTEPGNSISSILGGGTMLTDGGSTYYANNGLWIDNGSGGVKLTDADGQNLNLSSGQLYYTVGAGAYRMPAGGGEAEELFTADTGIVNMYVMGDEIRYLAGGALYSYDMTDGQTETLPCPEGARALIPTKYGNLFLTGSASAPTLSSVDGSLLSDFLTCYPDGEWLIVNNMSGTWQTSLSGLFEGSASLQAYDLHSAELAAEQSGADAETQLQNEAAFLESDEYAEISAPMGSSDGIMTVASGGIYSSDAKSGKLNNNQQNIIFRAQQMADVTWKAQKWIYSWGGNDTSYISSNSNDSYTGGADVVDVDNNRSVGKFEAGHTYKGVPYSQAVSTGYVGWELQLKDFRNAVADPNNVFYRDYSTFYRTGPYYGSDCSGFVSYAWDLPSRCTCQDLLHYSSWISPDINNLIVGDSLNDPSSHVVLITDIVRDANNPQKIIGIEVTEQTPPKMRVSYFRDDGVSNPSGRKYDSNRVGTLLDFTNRFFNQGFSIYRRNYSGSVSRPSDQAGLNFADSPNIFANVTKPGTVTISMTATDKSAKIYYTMDGSTPGTWSTPYSGPFEVTKGGTQIQAIAVVSGKENSYPQNVTIGTIKPPVPVSYKDRTGGSVYYDGSTYYVPSGDYFTMTAPDGGTVYFNYVSGIKEAREVADPTTSSNAVTSVTGIPVGQAGVTVKAFSTGKSNVRAVPSQVVTFHVKSGTMHTVTIDDPYGLSNASDPVLKILSGNKLSLDIKSSVKASNRSGAMFTYADLLVKKGSAKAASQGTPPNYTVSDVEDDYTIQVVAKLTGFTDVPVSQWYYGDVVYAQANGLMNGIDETKFQPDTNMNRAMFITVLGRMSGVEKELEDLGWKEGESIGITQAYDVAVREKTSIGSREVATLAAMGQYVPILEIINKGTDGATWYKVRCKYKAEEVEGYVRAVNPANNKTLLKVCNFTDLTGHYTYSKHFAQWAYFKGIVNGKSDTLYGVNYLISRQDICVMIYNYLTKYLGKSDSELVGAATAATFKDSGTVSSYAKKAVDTMIKMGLLNGIKQSSGTYIFPKEPATRAQVAAIVKRLDKFLGN